MDNRTNLCGSEIMGYTLVSELRRECFGQSYAARSQNGGAPSKAVIHHVSLPTDAQYASILSKCGNDVSAADEHIAKNIELLSAKLSQLKQIAAPDQYSIAPIYDYVIKKQESSKSYDIFVSTKQMLPLARFIEVNGLTVRDGMQFAMQLLGALDIAHAAALYHNRLDLESIYVDENGRCKIFGLVLAHAASAASFELNADSSLLQRQDTVGAACVMYKLFNNLSFPADSFAPLAPDYRANLYAGTQISSIIPPAMSNAALADTILRAFSGPVSSYATCEQFAAALGTVMQSFDDAILSASVISPVSADSDVQAAPVQKLAPEPQQQINNKTYAPMSPVVPAAQQSKSSKPIIITIAAVSAVLVITVIVFILWKFVFSGSDSQQNQPSPTTPIVEIDGSSLLMTEEDTTTLVFTVKNISENDLYFESSDESVVTVDDDGVVTAVGEGQATVSITDSVGKKLDSIKVTVEAKPDVDKINVAQIENMLAGGSPGSQYGMYVIDVATGKEYEFSNSNDVLGSSALVTVPLLYTYGKWLDNGKITENSRITFEHTYVNGRGIYKEDSDGEMMPASQIVSAMLAYSDNNCINTLMNYFGTDEIENIMRSNGMNGTNVLRNLANNPPDNVENQISARDAGQMLYEIVKGDVAPGKDFLDSYFRISDKYGNAGMGSTIIPKGAVFLNHNAKTTTKYNEIAYVESGDTKFIIVFISNGGKPDDNVNLAAQIAETVYNGFTAQ